MRRDPDLERQILLAIESHNPEADRDIDLNGFTDWPARQVSYQIMLLDEAQLIKADELPDTEDDVSWSVPQRLTMAGHEYLDTIRDEEVWRRTKEGARVVGSFSLDTLGALARGLLREKIRKNTGVEVDL
jgi:hypothetical protein